MLTRLLKPRYLLRRKKKRFRRSCIYNFARGLSRIHDRSLLPWTDSCLYPASKYNSYMIPRRIYQAKMSKLIGNYGVPSNARDANGLLKYFESPQIQASAIVVADAALEYSHWTAVESLSEWTAREGVPAVSGVDTRAIVTFLRERGSSLARVSCTLF